MPKRSKVSAEQRCEAVLRMLRKETTALALGREFGVSEATLYHWREKFLRGGMQACKACAAAAKGASRSNDCGATERDRIIGEQTVVLNSVKKPAWRISRHPVA